MVVVTSLGPPEQGIKAQQVFHIRIVKDPDPVDDPVSDLFSDPDPRHGPDPVSVPDPVCH